MNDEQLRQIAEGDGFIAALDQSGGSTPKALKLYGVDEDAYSGEEEMFDLIHAMRSRIVTSSAFDHRILGAILFEQTMDREIDGQASGDYLWNVKKVVPFLKIDKGLADESNDVQMMKPIDGLEDTVARGVAKNMFGTKMRSVVKMANQGGIDAIVDQQFEIGLRILDGGLMPIIEPEVDINSPEKAAAEELLAAAISRNLDALSDDAQVMLKLSLPSVDGFYSDLVAHPKVLKIVALSGGYARDEANAILARNPGIIASFSRALSEGLSAGQSDAEFEATIGATIESIYQASVA